MHRLLASLILTLCFSQAIEARESNAYSQPDAHMPMSRKLDFHVGNSFFRNPWVVAPATTTARDGLGPLFNTNACQNCHIKDGRGHLRADNNGHQVSLLLRLSLTPKSETEKRQQEKTGPLAVPHYGTQLQDFALPGQLPAEGRIHIDWETQKLRFNNGDAIELRKPRFSIKNPAYGPLPTNLQVSARIAPPMIGLGLLAAIKTEDLKRWSDPEDLNKDGISGKLNWVPDLNHKELVPGRFGWKSGQAQLRQQNAAAFSGDMGLTTTLFPQAHCQPSQTLCRELVNGGEPEVSDKILEAVTFYSENLAVPPARTDIDKNSAEAGKALFNQANCGACHKSEITTGPHRNAWLSERSIAPFSDLLLHDMGPGLADHRPEFAASGQEWRTAPLWGIGYSQLVEPRSTFLHDGRARNLLEAILWHGGEAESSQKKVLAMTRKERQDLINYIKTR